MKPTTISPNLLKKNQQNARKGAEKKAFKRGATKEIRSQAPSIELFQREDCPSSHAVRNHLTRLGLDFVAHTVPDGDALKHDQLVKAGGKDQIPFLVDHTSGVKLYESQAIIAYLAKAYGKTTGSMLSNLAHGLDTRIRARADQIVWSLQMPYEKVTGLRDDVQNAVGTIRGSLDFLRERLELAMRRNTASAASETPSDLANALRPSSLRPDVASATEAA